jgi:hypothetical protein
MLRNDRRIAVSDWSINQRTSGSTASASTPMVASTTPPIVWRSSLLSGLSPAIALFPSVRQLGLRRVHGAAVVAFDHDHHDSGRVTAGAEDHLRHDHRNGKNDAESKCGRNTRVSRWEAELLRSISSIKQDASAVNPSAQPTSRTGSARSRGCKPERLIKRVHRTLQSELPHRGAERAPLRIHRGAARPH